MHNIIMNEAKSVLRKTAHKSAHTVAVLVALMSGATLTHTAQAATTADTNAVRDILENMNIGSNKATPSEQVKINNDLYTLNLTVGKRPHEAVLYKPNSGKWITIIRSKASLAIGSIELSAPLILVTKWKYGLPLNSSTPPEVKKIIGGYFENGRTINVDKGANLLGRWDPNATTSAFYEGMGILGVRDKSLLLRANYDIARMDGKTFSLHAGIAHLPSFKGQPAWLKTSNKEVELSIACKFKGGSQAALVPNPAMFVTGGKGCRLAIGTEVELHIEGNKLYFDAEFGIGGFKEDKNKLDTNQSRTKTLETYLRGGLRGDVWKDAFGAKGIDLQNVMLTGVFQHNPQTKQNTINLGLGGEFNFGSQTTFGLSANLPVGSANLSGIKATASLDHLDLAEIAQIPAYIVGGKAGAARTKRALAPHKLDQYSIDQAAFSITGSQDIAVEGSMTIMGHNVGHVNVQIGPHGIYTRDRITPFDLGPLKVDEMRLAVFIPASGDPSEIASMMDKLKAKAGANFGLFNINVDTTIAGQKEKLLVNWSPLSIGFDLAVNITDDIGINLRMMADAGALMSGVRSLADKNNQPTSPTIRHSRFGGLPVGQPNPLLHLASTGTSNQNVWRSAPTQLALKTTALNISGGLKNKDNLTKRLANIINEQVKADKNKVNSDIGKAQEAVRSAQVAVTATHNLYLAARTKAQKDIHAVTAPLHDAEAQLAHVTKALNGHNRNYKKWKKKRQDTNGWLHPDRWADARSKEIYYWGLAKGARGAVHAAEAVVHAVRNSATYLPLDAVPAVAATYVAWNGAKYGLVIAKGALEAARQTAQFMLDLPGNVLNGIGDAFQLKEAHASGVLSSGARVEVTLHLKGSSFGSDWAVDPTVRVGPPAQVKHFVDENIKKISDRLTNISSMINSHAQSKYEPAHFAKFPPATVLDYTWTRIDNPGSRHQNTAADLAVGGKGRDISLFMTSAQDLIYRYSFNSKRWSKMPGAAKRLGVGSDGNPWVVNKKGGIFYWDAKLKKWFNVPGKASDIAVGGDGSVWVIGNKETIYSLKNKDAIIAGNHAGKPVKPRWDKKPGKGTRIAVDGKGSPWVTNSAHQIFRWTGHSWEKISGKAWDIGVGANGDVWVIGSSDHIFKFVPKTKRWVRVSGAAASITVDAEGKPWVVNAKGMVWTNSAVDTSAQN